MQAEADFQFNEAALNLRESFNHFRSVQPNRDIVPNAENLVSF